MTLQELGFHKTAGAAANLYKMIKPSVLEAMNVRSKSDYRGITSLGERAAKIMPNFGDELENLPQGLFSTSLNRITKGDIDTVLGKTQSGIINNLENQNRAPMLKAMDDKWAKRRLKMMGANNIEDIDDKLRTYQRALDLKENTIRGLKRKIRDDKFMRQYRDL